MKPVAPAALCVLGSVALGLSAWAKERAPLDLAVHHLPIVPTLAMRAVDEKAADASEQDRPQAGVALPSRLRDLQEKVIFRFQGGYALEDSAPTQRQYYVGELAAGTRALVMPVLSAYFLSQFHFDREGASSFSALGNVYDQRDGRALLVHAGYAELAGMGEAGGLWHPLRLRAGRQFRYGAGMFSSQFDGLTVAYETAGIDVSGFVGRRVLSFLDDEPGVLGGASARLRLRPLLDWPMLLALDFVRFAERRTLAEAEGAALLPRGARVSLWVRFLQSDQDSGLARLWGRVRLPLGKRLVATLAAEEVFAREDAFDPLSPRPADVADVAESVRLGLPRQQDATRLAARVFATVLPGLEASAFGKKTFVHGEPQTGFQTSSSEAGLGLFATHRSGWSLGVQVKGRRHELSEADRPAGGAFAATAGAGTRELRELSGEARYRPGAKLGLAVLGYLRSYDVSTPYADIDADARWGGRADVEVGMSKSLRLKLTGEAAQPSSVLAEELGTLWSARLLAEASF
jgi:hypothetical protein